MTIPTNLRVPFMAIEFDPSRAFQGASILNYQALVMVQKTASGSSPELTLERILSADEAGEKYGLGSQGHRMFEKWFKNNKFTDVFGVAIDDLAAGVAATGTIAITGPATADGILSLFINGRLIQVGVVDTDTETEIGDAVDLAIAAATYLPVTSSNAAGTVTFIAKNKGLNGDDIDIQVNFNDGEALPAGIGITIVAMGGVVSGAGNPDIEEILDILGDEWYNVIVVPWTDSTNMVALETELADRFGPTRQIDGEAFISFKGSLADLATFGNGRNSPSVSCPNAHSIPNATEEMAAAVAAQHATEASIDPARPFQTLPLFGIVPPKVVDRFTLVERNSLLFDGISTYRVDSGGVVRIEGSITMYQKNALDAADIAYLQMTTLFTLMYLRWDFRTTILTKYPRAKLADDGVRIAAGQQVITPKIGKAEAVSKFRAWELQGLVENIDQFKTDLICVRDENNPNRLNWLLPPDLMNQFIVGATQLQFLLQTPTT